MIPPRILHGAAAVAAAVMLAGGVTPVAAAPDKIAKAPPLPDLPAPGRALIGIEQPRAIPALGNSTAGLWMSVSKSRTGNSRTRVKMPVTQGVPLMADWNGDGVATPGVFTGGDWLVTNAAVGSASWQGFASFGSDGDIPLTGHRDSDGKADIATFRDGVWNWRDSTGRQETFVFGDKGDIPVVGDWNGDGVDDPGVVRGRTWIVPRPNGEGTRSFEFGAVGDIPIAGDWDADGKDGPGVVRDNQRWILARSVTKTDDVSQIVFRVDEGESPLVGLQSSAPGACPTATAAAERFGKVEQRKVRPPLLPSGNSPDSGISRNQCNAARRYARGHGHRPDRSLANPHDDGVLRPIEQRAVHGGSDPSIGKRGAQCGDLVQHERLHQGQPHHPQDAPGLRPVAHSIDFLCSRIDLPGWMGEWLADLAVGCRCRSSRVDAVERA